MPSRAAAFECLSRGPPEYFDRSGYRTAEPDDRARQLRASRPYKTGHADNLALAHRERNI